MAIQKQDRLMFATVFLFALIVVLLLAEHIYMNWPRPPIGDYLSDGSYVPSGNPDSSVGSGITLMKPNALEKSHAVSTAPWWGSILALPVRFVM